MTGLLEASAALIPGPTLKAAIGRQRRCPERLLRGFTGTKFEVHMES